MLSWFGVVVVTLFFLFNIKLARHDLKKTAKKTAVTDEQPDLVKCQSRVIEKLAQRFLAEGCKFRISREALGTVGKILRHPIPGHVQHLDDGWFEFALFSPPLTLIYE
jgi:hypothetical protein